LASRKLRAIGPSQTSEPIMSIAHYIKTFTLWEFVKAHALALKAQGMRPW
jgi:hypothetical protein